MHIVHNRAMNALHDYLIKAAYTQKRFADAVGVDQSVISKLSRGRTSPGLDLAVKIERATGGAVPASSWVEIDPVRMKSSQGAF